MTDKSLVFVKPRNEDIAQRVFDYLGDLLVLDEECHLISKINHLQYIPETIISEHYMALKKFDEELFRATMGVYRTGTIFLASYSGTNIIPRIRTKIGN